MKKIFLIIAGAFLIQGASAQEIDRSKKPKAGPAPVISIKDPAMFKLANGITVLVVENHKLPKVSVTYSIDAGPITEGKKAGVTSLMGQMLNEGTLKRSKAEFDEQVDMLGADVGISAGGGSASALTRYFDKAFSLMAEAIKQPAFTQESFDKLKSQAITGLKASEKSAKAISSRVTNALAYGVNHPKGEYESEETINAITLADIKEAYRKYITPSRGYLTFVGDITPAKALALAKKEFESWKGTQLVLPKLPAVNNPAKTEINLIDVPNAVQAEVTVLNLVNLPMSSPDYFPILLANQILGGGSESRLFMNLREKHSFTYGAYSSVGTGRFQSTFEASAAVRNEKADSAVQEILREISTMRTKTVSDQELADAKMLYNGNFAIGMENPARIAGFASNILINNLPKDFYRTYLQKINAVTKQDIQRVAQKYFNHDNTRIVVVGKASALKDNLAKLGYPVVEYDKWAMKVVPGNNKANEAAVAGVDATKVMNDYLDAIGGKDQLNAVKSISVEMDMQMQGMPLTGIQKKMAPNKELMVVMMQGQAVNKQVFDGEKGYEEQMGRKSDMEAGDIAEKKANTSIFDQLSILNNKAYKLSIKGIEKINGADAYKVEVVSPGGSTNTQYYDVKTKFLLREEEDEEGPGGMQVTVTKDYSDYKKVGNIMIPHQITITQAAGGQSMEIPMTVKSVKLNEGVSEADFK